MMRTMGMTMKIIKESKTFNFSSNSSPSNSQYQYNPKSHLIITPSRDQEIPSRHPSFYSCFLKVDRFEQIRWFGGSGDRSKTGDQASFDYRSFDRRKIVEIMLWIPVGIFFFDRIVGIVKITGTSMQPTLNPDSSCLVEDIVIVTKFDQKLDRGDIVTFRHPSDPCLVLAKRIIGLEKDLVKVRKTNDLNRQSIYERNIFFFYLRSYF
ncbi:expressed protein [Phakopsora pachyrhizi]|uniref:Expressed protein n=1 Tax=Phakopsora pachyrhizi TaxID=170000 RepID=A0AAV0ACZ1_PHAPC|nr:expressed protein [Phakopsora pachyrhizi]